MNILYIGQYQPGSTSRMRGEVLRAYFKDAIFNVIDTSLPFEAAHRVWRSLAFRYKKGPLINRINKNITNEVKRFSVNTATTDTLSPKSHSLNPKPYSLIWVDKGVFITRETTIMLREIGDRLVHFTPDPAFSFHRSHHFFESLPLYDYAVTSKSYEVQDYHRVLSLEKTILVTQGYQKDFHKPRVPFEKKESGVLFIGHFEKERGVVLEKLLEANIPVAIAGIHWERFAKKHRMNLKLSYLGSGIYGEDYVKTLSGFQFSWGAISKWIPELHTTRTFEIPACGTALVTERNVETSQFFTDEEAIFYDTPEEMMDRIRYYLSHPLELEFLTAQGQARVNSDGRDYECILNGVLDKVMSIG